MANEYDFQSLERDVNALERKYEKFEDKKDSILYSVKNLKFNEREYGKSEVERKIKRIIDNGKSELNVQSNNYINSVKRLIHTSTERIKARVRETNLVISDYVSTLNALNELNLLFDEGNYSQVITITEPYSKGVDLTDEIARYFFLIRLKSYDALCSMKLKETNEEDLNFFVSYLTECRVNNATNHLQFALAKLFSCCFNLSKISSDETKTYELLKLAIQSYEDLSSNGQTKFQDEYNKLYNQFVEIFNKHSDTAYQMFDLIGITKYLLDAPLLDKNDVKINVFKANCQVAEAIFGYVKEMHMIANTDKLIEAINMTSSLMKSDKKDEYLTFWLEILCNNPSDNVLSEAFSATFIQSNDEFYLNLNDVIIILLTEKFKKLNCAHVLGMLMNCFNEHIYLNNTNVPLIKWASVSLNLNSAYQESLGFDNSHHLSANYHQFAKIVYSIILKNVRLCAGIAGDIAKLDSLYLAVSKELFNKAPKVCLTDVKNAKKCDENTTITYLSLESISKRRNQIIIVSVLLAILSILLILAFTIL